MIWKARNRASLALTLRAFDSALQPSHSHCTVGWKLAAVRRRQTQFALDLQLRSRSCWSLSSIPACGAASPASTPPSTGPVPGDPPRVRQRRPLCISHAPQGRPSRELSDGLIHQPDFFELLVPEFCGLVYRRQELRPSKARDAVAAILPRSAASFQRPALSPARHHEKRDSSQDRPRRPNRQAL